MLANDLAQEVLGRTVDELLPQTRKLLLLLHEWVASSCEERGIDQADFRFTRRLVREALGWGDTQLKIHLSRLVDLELLIPHRGKQGRSYLYELIFQGEDAEGRAKLLGLIVPTRLGTTAAALTSRGKDAQFAGHGRGLVGGRSAGGQGTDIASKASSDAISGNSALRGLGTAVSGVSVSSPSKTREV